MYVTTKIERHRQSNYSFGLVMCCFRDFLKVKGKILKALSCTDAKIIRLKIDIAVTVIHRLFLRWCGVQQDLLRCCGVQTPPMSPSLSVSQNRREVSYWQRCTTAFLIYMRSINYNSATANISVSIPLRNISFQNDISLKTSLDQLGESKSNCLSLRHFLIARTSQKGSKSS